MLNHIVLQGRFVRDPELRRTQSGAAVCSFTLAVDRDFKDQSGNKQTDFIEHVAWRGAAEHICKHFHKGSMAVTEGRLELSDWTDKEGNKRRSAAVRLDNIYFGDSKKSESAAQNNNSTPAQPEYSGTANFEEQPDIDDDDLPF